MAYKSLTIYEDGSIDSAETDYNGAISYYIAHINMPGVLLHSCINSVTTQRLIWIDTIAEGR